MTKNEIRSFYGDRADEIIAVVREKVRYYETTWSVVNFVDTPEEEGFIPCGYRKNTTGEYVPNAYRRNFGWKNTFYQRACLNIYISPRWVFAR